MMRVMLTDENGFTTEPAEYKVEGGRLEITLGKTSAAILCQEDDAQVNYADKKRSEKVESPTIFEHENPGADKSGRSIFEKLQNKLK